MKRIRSHCRLGRHLSPLASLALATLLAFPATADDPPARPGVPDPELIQAVRQAQQMLGDGKYDEAIKVMAAEAKKRPKDRNALMSAAIITQQAAFSILEKQEDREGASPHLYTVAKYMRQIRKLSGGKLRGQLKQFYATAIYNEACNLSLENKKDEALKALKEAVDAGFAEYDVIKDDADFKALREDSKYKEKFQALVERVKNKTEKPRVRT